METSGRYFDGARIKPLPVQLRLLGSRLIVTGPGVSREWDCRELRVMDAALPLICLGPEQGQERIEFADEALEGALVAMAPHLSPRVPLRSGASLILGLFAVAVAMLLIGLLGVPRLADNLAFWLPEALERRLGHAAEAEVVTLLASPPLCSNKASQAVLDRLVHRLVEAQRGQGPEQVPEPVHVAVRKYGSPNALTLPGGRIVIFSALIGEAETPDELAGVIAHELGHAAARDPMRMLLRASGTAFLFSFLLGDVTGSVAIAMLGSTLIETSFERDRERAADDFAVEAMIRAGADATALATILERMTADEGEGIPFLRTHPETHERAAAIRSRGVSPSLQAPLATDAEWAELKAICTVSARKP
jgi:predicted Zn-dependent protease